MSLFSSVWLYNSDSGSVIEETQAEASIQLRLGLGWHGPFSSKQDALNYYAQNATANPGWKAPAWTSLQAIENDVTNNPVSSAAASAAKSVIPSAFNLVFGNTSGLLTRFLKVTIGGIILIAGILKLTNTDKTLKDVLPLIGGPAGKVLSA